MFRQPHSRLLKASISACFIFIGMTYCGPSEQWSAAMGPRLPTPGRRGRHNCLCE